MGPDLQHGSRWIGDLREMKYQTLPKAESSIRSAEMLTIVERDVDNHVSYIKFGSQVHRPKLGVELIVRRARAATV